MANEITVSLRLLSTKVGAKMDFNPGALSVTMSGTRKVESTQDIGTSHEILSINSDFGTAGYAYFTNVDATNFVELGILDGSTFESFGKLKAGQSAIIPLTTKAVYAKADTATVKLAFGMLEV